MSFAVGTNSWASVADADSYLEFIPGSTDWFAMDDSPATPGAESKESYLVMAFQWLISASQFTGLSSSLSSDNVKEAQIEAGLFLLHYREDYFKRSTLIASGVESFKMSRFSEKLGRVDIPDYIANKLSDYTVYAGRTVQLGSEDYTDFE